MIVKATQSNITRVLRMAFDVIASGGIVAYPTETFYGLGAKYDMESSLDRLCSMKERPLEKAMPLIIGNRGLLACLTSSTSVGSAALMERFWPGPLTLVLPARENLSRFITAGTRKVAVRMPGVSFGLDLARVAEFPITATSANVSGMPPAGDAEAVLRYFGDAVDLVVDAGAAPGGLPSTIVEATRDGIKILREGVIKKEALLSFLGKDSLDFH